MVDYMYMPIQGSTLTCVGMELAFRILYFTSSAIEGGLQRLMMEQDDEDIMKLLILVGGSISIGKASFFARLGSHVMHLC